MQMLSAGGVPPFTDSRRAPDDSNPRGYFESERVMNLARESAWVREAEGHALKVIAPLIGHLPHGPDYRVVFVLRHMDEVLASQATMLAAAGRGAGRSEVLRTVFERHLSDARRWARTGAERTLEIEHADLLAQPTDGARRLAEFVGGEMDVEAMVTTVEPSLSVDTHQRATMRSATNPSDAKSRLTAWYAATAAGVLGVASNAEAQIVYTDLEPDGINEDTEDINIGLGAGPKVDFDGDGDFEIVFGEDLDRNYTIMARDTEAPDSLLGVMATLVPFGGALYAYPIPMNAGAVVQDGPDLITGYSFFTFTFTGSDPNLWIGAGDAYVGVKFQLDDGPHFGWVRVEMTQAGRILVKDWAYETAINTPITAGDVGTAVEPGALPEGYVFSNVAPHPVAGASTFEVAVAVSENVRVDLVDVRGRVVATLHDGLIPANQRRQLVVDSDGLAGGVYLLRVTGESFVSTRRIAVVR